MYLKKLLQKGVDHMEYTEILQKIQNVKNGKSSSEIFDKVRPPEEFGDAVELFYNKENNCFKANVIDPYSRQLYSEKLLTNESEVLTFIRQTLK